MSFILLSATIPNEPKDFSIEVKQRPSIRDLLKFWGFKFGEKFQARDL